MPFVLRLAASYHLVLFALIWTIPELLAPDSSRTAAAADFWRAHAIGTSFGLGVGLLLASFHPLRQWAVIAAAAAVCVMMLSVSGLTALRQPQLLLPWWHLAFGYAAWLAPFGIILNTAWQDFLGSERVACPEIQRMAMRTRTSLGVSIDELSRLSPVMVVFLRHLGCPFCREALSDLASARAEIERDGTRLLLVHLASEREIVERLAPGLADVVRLADPHQVIYRAFGLGRGGILNVFGPLVWVRFLQVAFLRRRGFSMQDDIFQMPGVFMVYHGQVIRSFRHQKISDRPDYRAIAGEPSLSGYQGT